MGCVSLMPDSSLDQRSSFSVSVSASGWAVPFTRPSRSSSVADLRRSPPGTRCVRRRMPRGGLAVRLGEVLPDLKRLNMLLNENWRRASCAGGSFSWSPFSSAHATDRGVSLRSRPAGRPSAVSAPRDTGILFGLRYFSSRPWRGWGCGGRRPLEARARISLKNECPLCLVLGRLSSSSGSGNRDMPRGGSSCLNEGVRGMCGRDVVGPSPRTVFRRRIPSHSTISFSLGGLRKSSCFSCT